MTPANMKIELFRNDDPWTVRFNITEDGEPVDMTAYTLIFTVRLRPGAPGEPLLIFSSVSPTPAGSLLATDSSGFDLAIHREDLAAMPQDTIEGRPFTGAYDIIAVGGGGSFSNPWYFGEFVVKEGVGLYAG